MQITLPPEAQAIIDRKLASGEYATEADVIVSALVTLDRADTRAGYDPRTDPKLREAMAQAERGNVLPWTDELRAEIRRDAIRAAASGAPVDDDVTY